MKHPLPWPFPGGLIRRLTKSDLAAFQAYRQDAEVARYQGWARMDDAEALAFLVEMEQTPLWNPGEWIQLGIAPAADAPVVGDLGIHLSPDAREAEIGYTLARPAQGRGIATAAVDAACRQLFAATAIERITATTDQRNGPSIRVLERVGFVHESTRVVTFRGEACTELTFALARPA
jgi:aminoglycoside 6'-N-acetyltransferase